MYRETQEDSRTSDAAEARSRDLPVPGALDGAVIRVVEGQGPGGPHAAAARHVHHHRH